MTTGQASIKAVFIAAVLSIMAGCNLPAGNAEPTATSTRPSTATAEPSAAPTTSETPPAPIVGTYHCSGHEEGTLASAAVLTLYPDGTYLDGPTPILDRDERRGQWRLREEEVLEFPGDSLFSSGEYDSERQHILIRLQEGVTMVHAEAGTLSCEPAPSMAPDN